MKTLASMPPSLFGLLSHEIRWRLVMALTHSDRRVQELVEIVDRPMNLVSYHLKLLRNGRLVQERRSSADARDIYYSLNLAEVAAQLHATEAQLHPGFVQARAGAFAVPAAPTSATSTSAPVRVLFLCTHNSARSQIAEGLLRTMGGAAVAVWSAGTEPGSVHPLAVRVMQDAGIDISGHTSTHLHRFVGQSFDYVITVCDKAREDCPVFPGDPDRIHWSIPDPAAVVGAEAARMDAFRAVQQELTTRLRYFLSVMTRVA